MSTPTARTGRTAVTTAIAAGIAAGGELAVLVDGPWSPRWYWRADLEAMQRTGRRYPDDHPAAGLRAYLPTEAHRPHPDDPEITGRVWRHLPAQRTRTRTREVTP